MIPIRVDLNNGNLLPYLPTVIIELLLGVIVVSRKSIISSNKNIVSRD
jgi:hypothetical protein